MKYRGGILRDHEIQMKQNPILVHRTFTIIKYSRLSNINESVCVLSPCCHLLQLRWNADSTEGRHPFRDKGIPLYLSCIKYVQIISKVFPLDARDKIFSSETLREKSRCSNRIGKQDDAEERQQLIKTEHISRGQVRAENEKKTDLSAVTS